MVVENFEFNADVQQLPSLIDNAFYSNKVAYLRELISNGSEALDMVGTKVIRDPKVEIRKALRRLHFLMTWAVTVYNACGDGTSLDLESGLDAVVEILAFSADGQQLPSLNINTFDSYKVACARELISNASDALDKILSAGLSALVENFAFNIDGQQRSNLISNTFDSNKRASAREVISNASDSDELEMKNLLVNVGWKKDFVEKSTPVLPISGGMGDYLLKKSGADATD